MLPFQPELPEASTLVRDPHTTLLFHPPLTRVREACWSNVAAVTVTHPARELPEFV